jgi:hypothetical protein
MDVTSLLIGFLLGIAAMYLISAFLLNPGQQVAETTETIITGDIKKLFDQLWQTHEQLLKEMKQDLDNPDFQFHREFYVLKKNWGWNRWGFHQKGPCLAYFVDDHNNLSTLLDTLASHKLISKIEKGNKKSLKFRLSENLVNLLRSKKTSQEPEKP